jgi:hypothetical protein
VEIPDITKSTLVGEAEYEISKLIKMKKTGVVNILQLPGEENKSKNKFLRKQ